MPVNSDIAWDDISAAALPIAIPIGIAGLAWYLYLKNKEQVEWFDKIKTPNWVIKNPAVVAPIDLATVAPIGYAAHLVCKEAEGTDRKIALGLYGAGLLVSLVGIPVFAKNKDLKAWCGVVGLAAGIFGATAAAFYKVNNNAGLMLVPLTAWLGYQTFGLAATIQANPSL